MSFSAPVFFLKSDLSHPNPELRVLNLIAITHSEALTSIFWLLKRVFYFYRPAESEKGLFFTQSFDVVFSTCFFLKKK
jgi:hypothetical protein